MSHEAALGAEPTALDVALYAMITAVREPNLRSIWRSFDEPLRVALAQSWILANETHPMVADHDRDELAATLADIDPRHLLWPYFADCVLADLQDLWRPIVPGTGQVAVRTTVQSVDSELVQILRVPPDPAFEAVDDDNEVALVPVVEMVLRFADDGWWVTGLGEAPAEPGWPPTFGS